MIWLFQRTGGRKFIYAGAVTVFCIWRRKHNARLKLLLLPFLYILTNFIVYEARII